MTMSTSNASQEQKIGPVYLVWNGEVMINAPVEKVWRHAVNYPSWQTFSTVRHISGTPGQEGEVVLLKKEEGFEFPPYLARIIKLDPGSRIIWKTYPQEGDTGTEFFGIVKFTVEEASGKTRFSYELLYEFLIPYQHESELQDFYKKQYAGSEEVFASIFPKLKRLAEQSA